MRNSLTPTQAKELACLLAIREGYCLYRMDDTLWKVFPNGEKRPLTSNSDKHFLWYDALEIISEERKIRQLQNEERPSWVKKTARFAHNAIIHPLMVLPFKFLKEPLEYLHEWTGSLMGDET